MLEEVLFVQCVFFLDEGVEYKCGVFVIFSEVTCVFLVLSQFELVGKDQKMWKL